MLLNFFKRSFNKKKIFIKIFAFGLFVVPVMAQNQVPIPFFDLGFRAAEGNNEVALSLQILFLLTILTLAPSIIIMTTSFIRVAIILKFVQRALSLQQEPPNQVLMGMALFVTFFIMAPTFEKVYKQAYIPYTEEKLNNEQFFKKALEPMREFMFTQTREKDIDLFLYVSDRNRPKNQQDISTLVLIPAFIISELTIAFQIGILLFIPFVVVDMIVASVLMSMGMIMLPPVMVSLPFKLILFILVDGWHLITLQTVKSFHLF